MLTRDQLLDLARGRAATAFDRSIDVHISRLRHRLEVDPKEPDLIKTVRSEGYVFAAPVTLNGAGVVKRWWDSTTTTIALTVVVAMVLGVSLQQMVSSELLYLGLARQQNLQQENVRVFLRLPGRIAALLEVLDAMPDSERPAIIAAPSVPKSTFVFSMGLSRI